MPFDAISTGKLLLDAVKFLDGKLSDKDQAAYRKFLRELTNYRMLTSTFEVEYAGSVVASAERLRQLIVETTAALPEKSGLESGLFALGSVVRRFLSTVDEVEASIRHELDLLEENSMAGVDPDPSRQAFLDGWKRAGYPERVLRDNHRLNVMQIQWPLYQMHFTMALGQLRGEFAVILSALCESTLIELPEPLASLTPGVEGSDSAA